MQVIPLSFNNLIPKMISWGETGILHRFDSPSHPKSEGHKTRWTNLVNDTQFAWLKCIALKHDLV